VEITNRSIPAASCKRLQRHDHLHRRAVRVRHDPVVRSERLGVDLADDERNVVLHPPVRGVVDDHRAGRRKARRPLARGRAARGEQRRDRSPGSTPDRDPAPSDRCRRRPQPCSTAPDRIARRQNATISLAGNARSRSRPASACPPVRWRRRRRLDTSRTRVSGYRPTKWFKPRPGPASSTDQQRDHVRSVVVRFPVDELSGVRSNALASLKDRADLERRVARSRYAISRSGVRRCGR